MNVHPDEQVSAAMSDAASSFPRVSRDFARRQVFCETVDVRNIVSTPLNQCLVLTRRCFRYGVTATDPRSSPLERQLSDEATPYIRVRACRSPSLACVGLMIDR